jgi:hypothetical protein
MIVPLVEQRTIQVYQPLFDHSSTGARTPTKSELRVYKLGRFFGLGRPRFLMRRGSVTLLKHLEKFRAPAIAS